MELVSEVLDTIRKYKMLSENDRVLIGLSGGPDSVCLASVLDEIKDGLGISLSAVYVDHGLRPDEAGKEADFCRRFCKERGIEFIRKAVNTKQYAEDRGMNLQEAARELRYAAFEEAAAETDAGRIAVGHNADDQAETVLMRLIRGSGRRGLSGIPPVRGKIIRPLIETGRSAIEEYLAGAVHESPLQYMTDSSNLKQDYFRNWLRMSLLKEIKERSPAFIQEICRTSDILREEDDYLETVVNKTLMRLITRKSDTTIELFLVPLGTIEKPVLRRVLRRAIGETKGLRGIAFVHIEDMMRLIKEGKAGDSLDLPGGIRVIKDYSLLKITTGSPAVLSEYQLYPEDETVLKETGQVMKASLEEYKGEDGDGRTSVLLDAGAVQFPLHIRPRKEGDFFYPLGFGKKKKLQDLFVDEKIPRDKRDGVPIVLSGNDIIWVAGHRADDRFKVTEGTKKFLRLEIKNFG